MQPQNSREIRLKHRAVGLPSASDFELTETPVPTPHEGQVLVRNSYISVDPYMRGRMTEQKSYVPPFQIGEPLTGGAIGQVVASKSASFAPGDCVQSMYGWREWYACDAREVQKIDPTLGPIQSYLGALGMTGLTAYAGLLAIAELKHGDRVFVSAASGAVGTIACQIAKAKGCYVVGSVGSEAKSAYLTQELGVDQAINYKTTDGLTKAVAAAFPDGIDVYFENVGGAHLQAALANMRQFGRIAVCGMIAQYNATEPVPGPSNLSNIIGLRLTIRGFLVGDHLGLHSQFLSDMARWHGEGKMKWRETISNGIESAPDAFIGLFKGEHIGKVLVRVGPDEAVK
ncbi:MAG: NADP-dependent oxidoreductase [Polyangiaceae bacterium]